MNVNILINALERIQAQRPVRCLDCHNIAITALEEYNKERERISAILKELHAAHHDEYEEFGMPTTALIGKLYLSQVTALIEAARGVAAGFSDPQVAAMHGDFAGDLIKALEEINEDVGEDE